MTSVEQKKNLKLFVNNWQGIGNEKQQTQQFWFQLLGALGYENTNAVRFEHRVSNGGFVDVWIPDVDVMIEMKSYGIDLDKPEPRQGKLKTPLEQVCDYADDVPRGMQPRYVITCNFSTFRVYDRDKYGRSELKDNCFEFSLEELANHPEYLNCIIDPANSRLEKEKQVSIKAGKQIGKLYDLLRKGYLCPDSEESMHSLNVLCVRLVFCMYCEDADLFEKDSFLHYLKGTAPEDVRLKLKNLFRALDTERSDRDPYDTSIKIFPYVNGGLFKEDVEIPNFTQEALDFLLNEVSATIDWSQISPTVFGGIFESTLNPETRRSGGMVFTPVDNIHKVIDPLFLDDLWKEFNAIREEDDLTPRQKDNRYKKLHQKICGLTFFDPACGSGNFLTETYLCLRKLEDSILNQIQIKAYKRKDNTYEYMQGQIGFTDSTAEDIGERISLAQFHGIEINDFAVSVAETALYISRLKANADTMMLLDVDSGDLPLRESAHIVRGNALTTDWFTVVSPEECDYIIGNPPFVGSSKMSSKQKNDIVAILGKRKRTNSIDYVAGWYYLALRYIQGTNIKCALVSTSSITQGEQVKPMWQPLLDDGIEILFAYRPFDWQSESEVSAAVWCVIIGFANCTDGKRKKKYIFDEEGRRVEVDHITPYLRGDLEDILIEPISRHIQGRKKMIYGNKPTDGGNFLFKNTEVTAFISDNPGVEKFIFPCYGATEFLNNKPRYCLWLANADEAEYCSYPDIVNRINAVRKLRLDSTSHSTQEAAKYPHRFYTTPYPPDYDSYLAMPEVSTTARKYIPIGYMDKHSVPTNKLLILPCASVYEFGILSSSFHNAWAKAVSGRLGNGFQYSAAIVYNNMVFPEESETSKDNVVECALKVLWCREKYEMYSLSDMYDPNGMPSDLLAAHKALDKAVEEAYGVDFDGDEDKIVSHLFQLYQQTISPKDSKSFAKEPALKEDTKKKIKSIKLKKK